MLMLKLMLMLMLLGKLTTKVGDMINALEAVWRYVVITDIPAKTNSTRFRNWPWGENWILCDQLAMVAAITDDKAVVSDFVFEQQKNTTQMATIGEKHAVVCNY